MQLAKFFAPFSGWFMTPSLRYYLYVWSSNASQGDPAQVVGGGNLSYSVNLYFTVGAGITSLPAVRSTEGQFPVLARRRRPADRRRVLSRLLHDRRVAEGRDQDEVQIHGDGRQQSEHARRQRRADRQQVQHPVVHAPVAADDGRVRPLWHVRRFRPARDGCDAGWRALHLQHRREAEPAEYERHPEQPDPADGRQRHLHARPLCSGCHGEHRRLQHDERRCRHQEQGAVARRGVLLAPLERFHRPQHRWTRAVGRLRATSCSRRR